MSGAVSHGVDITIDLVTSGPRCIIATATFGSELAPEVQLLRGFRDNSVMETVSGSSFMVAFNAWYYSFSPQVANYIATHWVERSVMKLVLYPLVGILALSYGTFTVASSYPEFAVFLAGILASSMIGAFYLGLPLSLLRAKIQRLRGTRAGKLLEMLFGITLLTGTTALMFGEFVRSPLLLMASSSVVVLSSMLFSAVFVSKVLLRVTAKRRTIQLRPS